MEKTIPVLSVAKAMGLLDMVIIDELRQGGASLADLARRMGMPVNSAHNLLKTLEACGYIQRLGRGRYAPGLKCRQIGRLNRHASGQAAPAVVERMARFAEDPGEGCVLAVLVGGERAVLASVDSRQAIRVCNATVDGSPFFAKATGRMLAAVASDDELEQILQRQGMPGEHWNGIGGRAELRRELSAIARRGWCRMDMPAEGLIAWACPVRDRLGGVWGVAGAYAPSFRCGPGRCRQIVRALAALAADLSAIISPRHGEPVACR
jgi:IclR family acetate operon transcriptional repressor